MGAMHSFQAVPPAAVSRVLATFDREQLAGFIAVAIDLLDLADGDVDIEANGDEQDHNGAEDDFTGPGGHGANIGTYAVAGCPVSDPEEEDDPAGQCDEDEINTSLEVQRWNFGPGCSISDHGGGNVEDEAQHDDGDTGLTPDYELDQTTSIPDALVIQTDRLRMKVHRDRIRRTRCDKLANPNWHTGQTHQLRED